MTVHLHTLKGCSPTPLAHYLKALGILRLIGQQADKEARGWWQDEHFCLLTKLSREELEEFFLERYEPTPLLSPWNKGSGFFRGNDPGLLPLENSLAPRFGRLRHGIKESRLLLDAVAKADAVIKAIKARTKTNITFQTDQQRRLLESSETYRICIDQLQAELNKADLPMDERMEIEQGISTIRSLVIPRAKPLQRAEATSLKDSTGYKRLLATAERRFKVLKVALLPDCQRLWRGPHAEWLAAAVVLDENGNADWPSLLGTGGNDGNLDFTNNFMQQLGALFDLETERGDPKKTAKDALQNCLWAFPSNKLVSAAVGQYQPGAAGGANSSTGFGDRSLVNSWDFVLMMEGSLLFTSRATRRLDPNSASQASAPFAVMSHGAGFATPGSEKAQRGEQWMPLWRQPATLLDVTALYGEARIQLDRQTANRPIDVARAISRLGVARGIEAFTRYGYLERNGQATLAVPLGRIGVRQRLHAYLLDDLGGWLKRIHRSSRDKHAPTALIHAERHLADTVFAALTHDYSPDRWQAILLAAAAVELIQTTGTAIEAGPIPPLQSEWIKAVDDGSPEVRLALALGSAAARYTSGGQSIDSVRHHWLPLEFSRFKTSDKRLVHDPRVVMFGRDPIADFGAVVERRLVEASKDGERRSRLVAASGCGARLHDLAQLLRGSIDFEKLAGLARAFMAMRWNGLSREHCPRVPHSTELPPEAWLATRLGCLPWPLTPDKDIPADPRIIRRLIAGDSTSAITVALQRLRSVGIRPPIQAGITDLNAARLWGASLVFPINRADALRAAIVLDPTMKGPLYA